jgi:methionine synthase II (cobalamin-independent)
VTAAVHDQVAGLDVITDGEQTRFDFNLSFMDISRELSSRSIAAVGRQRTTNAASIASSVNWRLRAAWVQWKNFNGCIALLRRDQF